MRTRQTLYEKETLLEIGASGVRTPSLQPFGVLVCCSLTIVSDPAVSAAKCASNEGGV